MNYFVTNGSISHKSWRSTVQNGMKESEINFRSSTCHIVIFDLSYVWYNNDAFRSLGGPQWKMRQEVPPNSLPHFRQPFPYPVLFHAPINDCPLLTSPQPCFLPFVPSSLPSLPLPLPHPFSSYPCFHPPFLILDWSALVKFFPPCFRVSW